MGRPDRIDLAILGAALATGLVTSPRDDAYWVTVAFATVVLTVLGVLVRLGLHTAGRASRERALVRELGGVDAGEAARQAVQAERTRISADVDACLRDTLRAISAEVADLSDEEDPRPRARRIHAHAREATVELRRQLGLLRTTDGLPVAGPAPAAGRRPGVPDGRDVAIGVASGLLAGLEIWAVHSFDPEAATHPASIPLSALAAATLVGRRTHAPLAALACAAVIGLGWLLPGVLVSSGAWMMWTLGGLAWTLGAARPRPATVCAALALGTVATGSRIAEDPVNAGLLVATVVVAWLIGAAVGWSRRRQHAAARQAAALRAEIDGARERAVGAERLVLARELHDVVSHAVGVIATQAAAAEVSWPADPATARRAMDTVAATARTALSELGQVPGAPASRDVDELVDRMRAAGVAVTLSLDPVPAPLEPVVYRIVQEGLTNAVRHAPAAAVAVRVEAGPTRVRVRVADDGPGPGGAGHGFGLAGLEERVSLLGGRLYAGPGDRGGFVVDVELPVARGATV